MFTIKCLFDGGHAVYECASYRVRMPGLNIGDTIADKDLSSIDMMDGDGNVLQTFTIESTIYAMNSSGKTVDTFHGAPRSAQPAR